MEVTNTASGNSNSEWEGAFDASAYDAARRVLEQDRARALGEVKQVSRKRTRAIIIVAIIWAICSVALALFNSDWLLVAEIGWVVVIAWAVFYLYPTLTGQGNLDEVFSQYADRLDALEAAEVALPAPADMSDLVAALDLVKLPEEMCQSSDE